MTRAEYLKHIFSIWDIVTVLSNKNGAEILRLRHKTRGIDIVVRSYPNTVTSYTRLKDITHQNIPIVYDALNFDDGQIVVEEFVNGITVAEMLEQNKFSYRTAKKIVLQLCHALVVLRSINVVHRDIKPENIIVTSDGTVKLIDFNASRIHTEGKQKDTVVLGTIGYAPPEQYGISQSDQKSDIYSLGVLLNVMLTGVYPSKKLARGRAGKIVLKCTQIDPNHRFQSIENVMAKL